MISFLFKNALRSNDQLLHRLIERGIKRQLREKVELRRHGRESLIHPARGYKERLATASATPGGEKSLGPDGKHGNDKDDGIDRPGNYEDGGRSSLHQFQGVDSPSRALVVSDQSQSSLSDRDLRVERSSKDSTTTPHRRIGEKFIGTERLRPVVPLVLQLVEALCYITVALAQCLLILCGAVVRLCIPRTYRNFFVSW